MHFCRYGWREGRRPNRYFDPAWYLEQHPDVRAADMNPLLHYLRHGDHEGRRPERHFDPAWYRHAYRVPADARDAGAFPRTSERPAGSRRCRSYGQYCIWRPIATIPPRAMTRSRITSEDMLRLSGASRFPIWTSWRRRTAGSQLLSDQRQPMCTRRSSIRPSISAATAGARAQTEHLFRYALVSADQSPG